MNRINSFLCFLFFSHFLSAQTGNVGIGNNNPQSKLHVSGGSVLFDRGLSLNSDTRTLTLGGARNLDGNDYARLNFQNFDDNGMDIDYTGARISSQNFNGDDGGDLRFYTKELSLLERMIITDKGSLGIGNSNPTSQMVLGFDFGLSPASSGETYLTIGDNGSLDESALIIGSGIGNFAKMVWQESVNELRFDLFKDGIPDIGILLLNDNGNVGIQNPNLEPSELLSVGDDFGTGLGGKRITIANSAGPSGLNIGEDIDNRGFILWDHSNNRFNIGTRSSATTYSQTLTVWDGKIGISNGIPQYHLHVGNGIMNATNGANTRMVVSDNDNGQRSAMLALSRTSAGEKVEAQFEANGGAGPSVIIGSASNNPLHLRTGNLTRMTISTSGSIGIGTTSPGWKLEVNGSAAKTGGGVWTATSDIRLKQDIRDYHPGLEDVLCIRPVRYRYNALSGNNTNQEHIGVIAQELQEVAPYMVDNFEKNGEEYLSVDASAMTYILINAVKELNATIEVLQEEIAELKTSQQQNK